MNTHLKRYFYIKKVDSVEDPMYVGRQKCDEEWFFASNFMDALAFRSTHSAERIIKKLVGESTFLKEDDFKIGSFDHHRRGLKQAFFFLLKGEKMKLELIDWDDEKRKFDIGNLEDIMTIDIRVVTGDEIAQVLYKDCRLEFFDSGVARLADFFDYIYNIYDYTKEKNLILEEDFIKRETSYDMKIVEMAKKHGV